MFAMFFGGFEILFILMALFIVPFALALFVFWIWMLVDCIKNKGLSDGEKIAWTLAIVFTHWLGALIYFFAGKPKGYTPIAHPT